MLGGIFALLSAITFGLNNASVRRGVLTGSVLQALSITVPLGVPIFLLVIFLSGGIGRIFALPMSSVLLLSMAGVIHFVFGRYCNYRSTKAIGGNLSGAWKQSSMIFALLLAAIFLGEYFTPLKVLGIALILAGATLTSRQVAVNKSKAARHSSQAKVEQKSTKGFQPNYKEGYFFAICSAFAYGLSPVLIRSSLENLDTAMSIVGGLVSYMAAALVVSLMWLIPGQWRHVRSVDRSSVKWFSLAAVLVGFSQMCRYLALSMVPVSVVTPIQSTSALFRVLFGWLINKEHEVFGLWVIGGAVVSMLGVLSLVVSLEFVQGVLPLSEAVLDFLSLRWP